LYKTAIEKLELKIAEYETKVSHLNSVNDVMIAKLKEADSNYESILNKLKNEEKQSKNLQQTNTELQRDLSDAIEKIKNS
jgi:hypothetical protein